MNTKTSKSRNWKSISSRLLLISLGVFLAGFGLKGFLLPNSFIDGGVMGISLLVGEVSGISLSILIVIINIPFLLLAIPSLGWGYVVRSLFAIAGLAFLVHIFPYPIITDDKLLIAVFGGFFLGSGIGLAIRGGAVLDGSELLAIFLTKKLGLTIGDIILIFNIIIFSFGAYILSVEVALYAILTYLAASRTVDFVVEGIEEYTSVNIISPHSEEIRKMITMEMGRGVTIYAGKGGYGEKREDLKRVDIIFTVITRLEISRLKSEINKIDPEAFIIMNKIGDIKGGIVKRKPIGKHKHI
jgi:uncharacterized membrane-anchored protein YitT (DUF2179 family)